MITKCLTVIVITFILCITGCSNSSSNVKSYLNSGTLIDSKAKDIMPELEDLPEYEFSVESYAFRVIDENGTSNTEFPKSFGMIGISEEKKSIGYMLRH